MVKGKRGLLFMGNVTLMPSYGPRRQLIFRMAACYDCSVQRKDQR
jgi:hypothetical protein